MRDVTERKEGVEAGTAILVGNDADKIYGQTSRLLNNKDAYDAMVQVANPYGAGGASARIVEIIGQMKID